MHSKSDIDIINDIYYVTKPKSETNIQYVLCWLLAKTPTNDIPFVILCYILVKFNMRYSVGINLSIDISFRLSPNINWNISIKKNGGNSNVREKIRVKWELNFDFFKISILKSVGG